MNRPASDPFRLSLTLDGPEVAWGAFVEAARSWNALLRSVDREVAGGRPNVTWVIQSISKASPVFIELAASPARADVKTEEVRKTVRAVTQGLKMIERGPRRPDYFSDRALESAKQLAELHDKNVTGIRVSNGRASVDLTKRLSANVDELIGPKTSSEGTVEGTLEVVSIHGRSEFSIFETLTQNRVRCFFAAEMLEEVIRAFGKRVAAHGEIFANASGRRLSVKVEDFEVFPAEEDLPGIDEIIGILK